MTGKSAWSRFYKATKQPVSAELPKKGPHHFVFAHVALRQACVERSWGFFAVMASAFKDRFLQDLWREVCAQCDAQGPPLCDITKADVTTCRLNNYPCVVVTMPPPSEMGEAYLVAVILKVQVTDEIRPDQPAVDYFTLEKGTCLDGTPRTVLCRWTADNSHVNYGDGPPATIYAFGQAISKVL